MDMHVSNALLRGLLMTALMLGATAPIGAQETTEDDTAAVEREAELAREIERERAARAAELEDAERRLQREAERALADVERGRIDVEIEMREAESQLADAARRVAELSTRRLPGFAAGSFASSGGGRPMLGVNIATRSDSDDPVEGVEIASVSPGGAAADAGLRAGDVITRINDEDLSADNGRDATRKLLDFMAGVEEGDELDVEYLRSGRSATVTVVPQGMTRVFSFSTDGQNFSFPRAPVSAVPPVVPTPPVAFNRYVFVSDGDGLGDMEMVSLTEDLGRYFGTPKGLLVVRSPEDADTYKLQDGDVILDIDGREPNSVSHAVRILGSYQAGETLEIRIMRDQRERRLEIVVPDSRTGALHDDGSASVRGVVAPRIVIEEHAERL